MKNSSRFPSLLNSDLLSDLPDDQKNHFLDQCSVQIVSDTKMILAQGEYSRGLYFVADGTVEVSYCSEDGNKSIIKLATAGDILGALEAVGERPCAADCSAFAQTILLFCATPLLFEHLKSPVFVRNLAAHGHDLLTRDNRFKSVDQFYTVEQKICMHLHQYSGSNAKFNQSQSYLAEVVGCSRQTINRELGVLRDLNIIEVGKGKIIVLERDALTRRIQALYSENLDRRH